MHRLISELVMRCQGLIFAQELFFEPRSDQAIPQILLPDFERAGMATSVSRVSNGS